VLLSINCSFVISLIGIEAGSGKGTSSTRLAASGSGLSSELFGGVSESQRVLIFKIGGIEKVVAGIEGYG
jgi:hypothetical protein